MDQQRDEAQRTQVYPQDSEMHLNQTVVQKHHPCARSHNLHKDHYYIIRQEKGDINDARLRHGSVTTLKAYYRLLGGKTGTMYMCKI